MLNTNRVRGILRARNGSQIPKFQTPAGGINLFNQNSSVGRGVIDNINNMMYSLNPSLVGSTLAEYKTDNIDLFNTSSENSIYGNNIYEAYYNIKAKQNIDKDNANKGGIGVTTDNKTKTTVLADGSKNGNKFGKQLLSGAKDFIQKNGVNIASAGLDALGSSYNDVENSNGVDNMFKAGDMAVNGLMSINPAAGLIGKAALTAFKGINSLGGKHSDSFSVNQDTITQVGSSYGGSVADINNAASKAGKKYGLFSGGARRDANRQITEARRQQNIMTDIADEASMQNAMSGNDLNYINYQFDINGGYDQRYMRAAKSGMKIQDKINFVKQRRFNTRINLDTKEIEWKPIITEVEEFKEGGIIQYEEVEWEPTIDDIADYWEPVIDDISRYKEGGKTKEELETPEIEETTQKNLIPEGALHKNKHHMEHTEGLTQKGIPVIDNEGEQQAEIELDEIIFTLEVTKKLEELYKDGSDEAAIEAGKLLVKEILFNTDDRTGLISKCEKGGKICQIEE